MRLMMFIKLVKLFLLWSESDAVPVTDSSLVLKHHVPQKLNSLLPLSVSLQKQQIKILYYLTQLQMTSNM